MKKINKKLKISFKKFFLLIEHWIEKKYIAQVTLEYFILFTVIIALTVIGLSTLRNDTFFHSIKSSFQDVQQKAIEGIINAGQK